MTLKLEGCPEKSTDYVSQGTWKGKPVSVSAPWGFCPIPGHALEPVLHYGEPGTGFLMCSECGGIAVEPLDDEEGKANG